MNNHLFQGARVRLSAVDLDAFSAAMVRWQRNSEFFRLEASAISFPHDQPSIKKHLEKYQDQNGVDVFGFAIYALPEQRLIGDISLEAAGGWNFGEAFVGIGIGEPDYWGKGYGTEAMLLVLRYAFTELNLHRVSLNVFAYNPRAIRSYEKAGFRHEGCQRAVLNRNGKRWDIIYMGILRSEWQAQTAD